MVTKGDHQDGQESFSAERHLRWGLMGENESRDGLGAGRGKEMQWGEMGLAPVHTPAVLCNFPSLLMGQ